MADARVQVILDAVDRTKNAMRSGAQGLGRVGTAADKTSERLKRMRAPLLAITGALTGIGVVGVKAASDLGESLNAVNVVFGEGAGVINRFGESAARNVGLAQAQFNQLAAVTGALLKDVGLPMEEVAGITTDLTTRAADLASVFNTSVDDALGAIGAAIRGETEAIRRYTGDVTDATLEQFALANGIEKSVSEMNQQEKRLLRVQVLMSQTAFATGDFANTSDSLANSMRITKAQMTDLAAEMGTALLPLATRMVNIVQGAVNWFGNLSDSTKNLIIIISGAAAGIAALGLVLPPLISGIKALIVVTKGFGLALTLITAHPILAFITAITAAVILLWRNWDTIWPKMKEVFANVANFFIRTINTFIIEPINKLIRLMNKIPGVSKKEWGAFEEVVVNTAKTVTEAAESMVGAMPPIVEASREVREALVQTGDAAQGMGTQFTAVKDDLMAFRAEVAAMAPSALSPMTEAMLHAQDVGKRLGIGYGELQKAVNELTANGVLTSLEAWQVLGDTLNSEVGKRIKEVTEDVLKANDTFKDFIETTKEAAKAGQEVPNGPPGLPGGRAVAGTPAGMQRVLIDVARIMKEFGVGEARAREIAAQNARHLAFVAENLSNNPAAAAGLRERARTLDITVNLNGPVEGDIDFKRKVREAVQEAERLGATA